MKALLMVACLCVFGCSAQSVEEYQTGGAGGEQSTESSGGAGGAYWGPWICKDIVGGNQCSRYPADSAAY